MRMAKILNCILCTIAVFLLSLTWVYYCLRNSTLALWLSVVVALATAYVVWRFLTERENGKKIKLAKRKCISALSEYLRFGVDNAQLFAEMLQYYRFEVEKVDYDNLIVVKNNTRSYVTLRFVQDSVSKDDLVRAVIATKRADCAKLYVFANKVDKPLVDVANVHVHTVTVDVANTYALLEQCDRLPELKEIKPSKRPFIIAKYAFNRRRFGWYFTASLFMLAIAVISFIPWYMLTWATINLALALYSLLNKRYNAVPTNVTLN